MPLIRILLFARPPLGVSLVSIPNLCEGSCPHTVSIKHL